VANSNLLTLTAIKADVGSRGGHTQPSEEMVAVCEEEMHNAVGETLLDCRVTTTGDDICMLMSHLPENGPSVNDLAWKALDRAGDIAKTQGLYGAKQDLLTSAPSGNVRGAGPGVASITFATDAPERPAETFMVVTADKCGPGIFNFLFGKVFTDPDMAAGLMLPNMLDGFTFTMIDMEHVEPGKNVDRVIRLDGGKELPKLKLLLRGEDEYGILAIHSNRYPHQQVASTSTDRLHSIAGVYKGKDDPVGLVRTQGIFPAPEELMSPFTVAPYVAGDARGSHNMPLMPVPINTAVTGVYCLPIVSAMAYSITPEGMFSEGVDMFDNPAWDSTRKKAQLKAMLMREQGSFGCAMLPYSQLEYAAYRKVMEDLNERFVTESR